MNAALLQAEQTVAVGPLAGPILHLRQRGDAARFSAMVFLFALVLAVLSGLAFYLGLPFWKQFVDGRRGTLDESIAATEQVMRTLDGEREGQRTALVEALRQVGERIVLPELQQPSFKGVVSLGFDSALAFGSGGTLISWTRAGGLVPDNSKEFRIFANIKDALAIDSDTALLFGDESEVLRWSRYGGLQREQTSLSLGFTNINGGIALGPDSALIFGTGGIANATAVRWTRSSGLEPITVTPELLGSYFTSGLAIDSNSALLFGNQSGVVNWNLDRGLWIDDRSRSEYTVLNGALAVDSDTSLVYGSHSTVLTWTRMGGLEPETVLPSFGSINYNGAVALDEQSALVFGDQGTVVHWTRSGGLESELALPDPEYIEFFGAIALDPDTALVYGSKETVARWTSKDGLEARMPLPGSERVRFVGGIPIDSTNVLIFGDDGTIIRISNLHSELASQLDLNVVATPYRSQVSHEDQIQEPGKISIADPLTTFISALPTDIRRIPQIEKIATAAQGIEAQRRVLIATKSITLAALNKLDQFPNSFLLLEKQREDFSSYMEICRGTRDLISPQIDPDVEADPDPMTLACLSGWQDQRASETQSWWQTLAAQVPPGILLLFLLSTLAALYRYNLRLAGFHHSRADALELMALGKTKEDIEQLASIAAVLAADKVIFGKSDDATRQAGELLKAVRGSV